MKATRKQSRNRRGGFTLIELLIVLGIILAIAAMVVPNLIGSQEEANIKQTKINIKSLEAMVKQYAARHKGQYPSSLAILMQKDTVDGQTLQPITDTIPTDAWGKQLYYEYPNTKKANVIGPAIWSGGVNGSNDNGGNDDINNWSDRGNLPGSSPSQ